MAEQPFLQTLLQGVAIGLVPFAGAWVFGGLRKQKSDEKIAAMSNDNTAAQIAITGFKDVSAENRSIMKELADMRASFKVQDAKIAENGARINSLEQALAEKDNTIRAKDDTIRELTRRNEATTRIAIRLRNDNTTLNQVIKALSVVMSADQSGKDDVAGALRQAKSILDDFVVKVLSKPTEVTYADEQDIGLDATILSAEVKYAVDVASRGIDNEEL